MWRTIYTRNYGAKENAITLVNNRFDAFSSSLRKAKNMVKSFSKRWYAFISGLPNVKTGEMVSFVNKNLFAMALNLEASK